MFASKCQPWVGIHTHPQERKWKVTISGRAYLRKQPNILASNSRWGRTHCHPASLPELCKLGTCVSLSEIFVYLWICVGRNNLGCSPASLRHHSYLCPIPHCSINFWYRSAILQRWKEVIKLICSAAMLIRHVYMIMPNGIILCLLRPRMIIIIRKFS